MSKDPYKDYKGKYIGGLEIKKVVACGKTMLGEPRVKVTFVKPKPEEKAGDAPNETAMEMAARQVKPHECPLAMLDIMVTKEPSDATELRDKRVSLIVEQMLGALAEAELTVTEIQHAIGFVLKESIDHNVELANQKIWGKPSSDVTLRDIDEKLKS